MVLREVERVYLEVCANGHARIKPGTECRMWQFINSCGHWVWPDANFCETCAAKVDKHDGGENKAREEQAWF